MDLMKTRTFRVDDKTWHASLQRAAEQDVKVADVLRTALAEFVGEGCDSCTCDRCGEHAITVNDLEIVDATEPEGTAAVYGFGTFDQTQNPDVQALIDRAKELLTVGAVGVSIATDLNPADLPADPDEATEEQIAAAHIRVRHVAIVDTPAFSGAHLQLMDDGTLAGPIVFEGTPTGDLRGLPLGSLVWDDDLLPVPILFDLNDGDHTGVVVGHIDRLERVTGTGEPVAPVTASIDAYPKYLFDQPDPTAMTIGPVDAHGYRRYSGIIAPTGVCHKGRGGCYTYKGASIDYFHTGARIPLDDGTFTRVGPLMFGDLHADGTEMDYGKALERTNEDARTVFAMGRVFHHPKGLLFSGVLMPDTDLMRVQATAPSVELWPDHRGRLELKTALQVPRPALPVAAALTGGGMLLVDDTQVIYEQDTPAPESGSGLLEVVDRVTRLEATVAELYGQHLAATIGQD